MSGSIHCSLFTVFYSLFTVHCSLFTVHCSLFTVHSLLFTLYSSLLTHNPSLSFPCCPYRAQGGGRLAFHTQGVAIGLKYAAHSGLKCKSQLLIANTHHSSLITHHSSLSGQLLAPLAIRNYSNHSLFFRPQPPEGGSREHIAKYYH